MVTPLHILSARAVKTCRSLKLSAQLDKLQVNEKLCLKSTRWVAQRNDNLSWPLASTYSNRYTYSHSHARTHMYTLIKT